MIYHVIIYKLSYHVIVQLYICGCVLCLATPFINATNPVVTAIGGERTELSCIVRSTPEPTLQDSLRWFRGGVYLTDDNKYDFRFDNNQFTLIIHDVASTDEGTYVCSVNNTHIPRTVNASVTLNTMPCKSHDNHMTMLILHFYLK